MSLYWNRLLHVSVLGTRSGFKCCANPAFRLRDRFHACRKEIHLWSLKHRAVVSVKGRDRTQLLQGLLTADVQGAPHTAQYTMLLNSQGRVLYEAILYHTDEAILLECDVRETDKLLTHLKKYALRAQVNVSILQDATVYCTAPGYNSSLPNHDLAVLDPRTKSMGKRIVSLTAEESESVKFAPIAQYHFHRMTCGILEGSNEVPVGQCLPLELNLDHLNGVSFDKGCYLGQELTARTHHTGVVRKRVLPLSLEISPIQAIPWGTAVLINGSTKPVGKVMAHQQASAVALIKLKEMHSKGLHLMLEGDPRRLGVNVCKPSWWPKEI